MFPRQLRRACQMLHHRGPNRILRFSPRRSQTNYGQDRVSKTNARAERVLNRVPRFLRRYTDGLRQAPISHVIAFLILHEITAVAPLVALASYFHYANWLPPLFSEGDYISSGVQKFGNYFRRKGWFGLSPDSDIPTATKTGKVWDFSETGSRVVVEVATAYAITKVLLPPRLMFSVWLTPWFARVYVRGISGRLAARRQRWMSRRGGIDKVEEARMGNAAGTGATGGGVNSPKKVTLK
ncbi:MAG: hypothetical protein M1818_002414 [Claussenomyces sp. TS43310]|nr:MAG: hypothetical protein M1818_002414 [Claussenomyces sp. TS43310]